MSAFIKSLRGNDPDAALYWLAAMVAAGEDPRFIARRLIISASEDVGNADPRALTVAVGAAQALDHVGLPEAQYALAQAATYLATAPKSNRSGLAYWAAVADIESQGALPVPNHLRSGSYRERKDHGIGVGYRYPHDFEGADVEQRYLPDELGERRYYRPTDQGYEATIGARMIARQEARETADDERRRPALEAAEAGGRSDAGRHLDHPDPRGVAPPPRRDRTARRRRSGHLTEAALSPMVGGQSHRAGPRDRGSAAATDRKISSWPEPLSPRLRRASS